ncbi:SMC-Scp complex subunit ScpB [Rhodopirellula sp. SWK7]|uniref:SMC-Scp complex subunit ScpB n=1 Tax=Rhodopirellula sp. SWK7 TaxID=595460 RepID=UPI0002BD80FD|nr:SMC-Scp complex subunit ScpB [Rhodopirellula sp. SWK7]EMI45260.1 transcriptional regulator [Rhodopirellula sp. SWK7]
MTDKQSESRDGEEHPSDDLLGDELLSDELGGNDLHNDDHHDETANVDPANQTEPEDIAPDSNDEPDDDVEHASVNEPEDEHEPEDDFEDDEDAFSLEELGAAYKHIVAKSDSDDGSEAIQTGEVLQREQLIAAQAVDQSEPESDPSEAPDDDVETEATTSEDEPESAATPEAIIEAALFVGHPNGHGVTAARLASIMRGMTPEEVIETIDTLNESYRSHRQGIRIAQDDSGYRLVVAPEVESIRHVFTGKVRETRLSQGAIEVLSLVAYQPGITAVECTDKRGRDSGPLLNQMVRRRLIEMRREPEEEPAKPKPPAVATIDPDEAIEKSDAPETTEAPAKPSKKKPKPKLVSKFYPAERLLVLLGLESLDDLPQVEEVHLE